MRRTRSQILPSHLRGLRSSPLLCLLLACGGAGGGGGGGGDVPPTPEGVAPLYASDESVDLTWVDLSGGEASFQVQRAADAAGAPATFSAVGGTSAHTTHFQDMGLSGGTSYWYRVLASVGGQLSTPSQAISITTPTSSSLPTAPVGLAATGQSASAIHLTWQDLSSDEEGFSIERARDLSGSPGAFTPLAQVGQNIAELFDNSLDGETTYWYRVRAFRSVTASHYSNLASATTGTASGALGQIDSFTLAAAQGEPELIFQDDGGTYLRAKSSFSNTLLLAFADDRSLRWQKEYSGEFRFARASDGNLWMYSVQGLKAGRVRASDGATLWAAEYSSSPQFFGSWLVEDRSPNAAPLGNLLFSSPLLEFGGVELDGSVGWCYQASFGEAHRLPDGSRVLLTRFDASSGPHLIGSAFSRIASDGSVLWQRTLDGSPLDTGFLLRDARVLEDGSIQLVAQLTTSLGSTAIQADQLWTARLDAHGALGPQTILHAPNIAYMTLGRSAERRGLGELFAAGLGFTTPWVFKFGSDGSLLWKRRVETPALDQVAGILPRPDGGCVLVGMTNNGLPAQESNSWLVALSARGDLDWERSLDAGSVDSPQGWVRTPDDGMLLAGSSVDMVGQTSSAWVCKLDDQGSVVSQAKWARDALGFFDFTSLPDGRHVLSFPRPMQHPFREDLLVAELTPNGVLNRSLQFSDVTNWGDVRPPSLGITPTGELQLATVSVPPSGSLDMDIDRSVLCDGQSSSDCVIALPPAANEVQTTTNGVATSADQGSQSTPFPGVLAHVGSFMVPVSGTQTSAFIPVFAGTTSVVDACGP